MNQNAFFHEYPGWKYQLTRFLGQQAADASIVAALFEAVNDVVIPLTADIEVRCCDRELLLPEPNCTLAEPARRLVAASLPSDVDTGTAPTAAQQVQVSQLDPDTLRAQVQTLLNQPCPHPETHLICLTALRCWTTRACLVRPADGQTDMAAADKLPVRWGRGTIEAPLLHAADGIWAAGPVAPLHSQPPIRLDYAQEAGMASFDLSVHWSPWTRTASSAAQALRSALERVRALGWDLTGAPQPDPLA